MIFVTSFHLASQAPKVTESDLTPATWEKAEIWHGFGAGFGLHIWMEILGDPIKLSKVCNTVTKEVVRNSNNIPYLILLKV